MAQITKEMAKLIMQADGNYPLTAWEIVQLTRAWLDRDAVLAELIDVKTKLECIRAAPEGK